MKIYTKSLFLEIVVKIEKKNLEEFSNLSLKEQFLTNHQILEIIRTIKVFYIKRVNLLEKKYKKKIGLLNHGNK